MTREECIQKIRHIQKSMYTFVFEDGLSHKFKADDADKFYYYLDMIVKYLDEDVPKEQEPCEDAISRHALLKLMGEEPFNWTDSDKELQEVEDYRNFRNMVEQLPSVNPKKPKTEFLDKLRAEIEELKPNNPNFKGYFEQNVALNKVLEVIDKYKAESKE